MRGWLVIGGVGARGVVVCGATLGIGASARSARVMPAGVDDEAKRGVNATGLAEMGSEAGGVELAGAGAMVVQMPL